jgi:hypothetical protein
MLCGRFVSQLPHYNYSHMQCKRRVQFYQLIKSANLLSPLQVWFKNRRAKSRQQQKAVEQANAGRGQSGVDGGSSISTHAHSTNVCSSGSESNESVNMGPAPAKTAAKKCSPSIDLPQHSANGSSRSPSLSAANQLVPGGHSVNADDRMSADEGISLPSSSPVYFNPMMPGSPPGLAMTSRSTGLYGSAMWSPGSAAAVATGCDGIVAGSGYNGGYTSSSPAVGGTQPARTAGYPVSTTGMSHGSGLPAVNHHAHHPHHQNHHVGLIGGGLGGYGSMHNYHGYSGSDSYGCYYGDNGSSMEHWQWPSARMYGSSLGNQPIGTGNGGNHPVAVNSPVMHVGSGYTTFSASSPPYMQQPTSGVGRVTSLTPPDSIVEDRKDWYKFQSL